MNQHQCGRLPIGLPLAAGLMLPMISSYMARYQDIELGLDFSDRLTDVIDEGMDVVIRGGDLIDSRLITRRLGSFRLCIVGSVEYFRRNGIPERPDKLTDHACIHYRFQGSGKIASWPLKHRISAAGSPAIPSTLICSSLEALLFMVKEGAYCLSARLLGKGCTREQRAQKRTEQLYYSHHHLSYSLAEYATSDAKSACLCRSHDWHV